jgi:enoyl-CoA hydratase/carnithine racemase
VALLGDRLNGQALFGLGLAHESVPDNQVLAAVAGLTERLAAHAPQGVRRIKMSLRRMAFDGTAEEWFDRALSADPLADAPMKPIAATDT